MPLIDPTSYQPRDGEAAMMSTEQREAACLAHYKRLAEAGGGRLIAFGDGSAWFVPNDLDAVARDIESVLTGKTGGLAGFVIAEALKVVVGLAQDGRAEPAAAPASEAPPPFAASMERVLQGLANAVTMQGEQIAKLAKANEPAPAAQPVQAISETICSRLEDAGYQHVDHNRPGVVREARAFVNLYNGAQLVGKEPVIPLATPQQCIEATMEGIERYCAEAGSKKIIWRLYPTLGNEPGGYVIRCRLLAMEGRPE